MRIAWLTPLSKYSDISFHSLTILNALRDAKDKKDDFELTIYAEPSNHYLNAPFKCRLLNDSLSREYFLDHYDYIIFNIGNNVENHRNINRLCLCVSGCVVVHDLMMQHYWAHQIMQQNKQPLLYSALMTALYPELGTRVLKSSQITWPEQYRRYAPWDSEHGTHLPMLEPFLSNASQIIVHSDFAARQLSGMGFDDPLKLWLPTDKKPTPETRTESPDFRITSFGDISKTKNYEPILDAVADFAAGFDKRVHYTIAGRANDRGYFQALENQARELTSSQLRIQLRQNISEAELFELKGETDAFINIRYPNAESASGSLAEQLATGSPVVVFNSGCYADLDDKTVEKIDSLDVTAISAALSRISEPKRYAALSKGARSHADKFTSSAYAEALLENIRDASTDNRMRPKALAKSQRFAQLIAEGKARSAIGIFPSLWRTGSETIDGDSTDEGLLASIVFIVLALMPEHSYRKVDAVIRNLAHFYTLGDIKAAAILSFRFRMDTSEAYLDSLKALVPRIRHLSLVFDGYAKGPDYIPSISRRLFGLEETDYDSLLAALRAKYEQRLRDCDSKGLKSENEALLFEQRIGELLDLLTVQRMWKQNEDIQLGAQNPQTLDQSFFFLGGHHVETSGGVWSRNGKMVLSFRPTRRMQHLTCNVQKCLPSAQVKITTSDPSVTVEQTETTASFDFSKASFEREQFFSITFEIDRVKDVTSGSRWFPFGRRLGVMVRDLVCE